MPRRVIYDTDHNNFELFIVYNVMTKLFLWMVNFEREGNYTRNIDI